MALVITGGGGLALLGGVLLIGRIVGSFDLDVVLAAGEQIRASALYPYALFLVLAGIFTKSAQFPFHFWLPHAMAAPTPVSAYLHSATMVKAGVFLLARLHPALAGSDLFFYTVSGIGALTLLIGAWNAIFQHDLKGLLAYSTISHLGLITLLFGLSTPMAVVAGVFHILNHATFKASLFMAAGIIDHETGTRDMRKLGGLRRLMPFTSALAIIASLAMAGIPLLNGFLSKEMLFAEAITAGGPGIMRTAPALRARHLLRPRPARPGPRAARAAALDEGAGGTAGGDLHRGRRGPGADRGTGAACRRRVDPRPGHARVQPGRVARLQPAAGDERDRRGRWRGALLRAAQADQPARRDQRQHRSQRVPCTAGCGVRAGHAPDQRHRQRQPAAHAAGPGAGGDRGRCGAVRGQSGLAELDRTAADPAAGLGAVAGDDGLCSGHPARLQAAPAGGAAGRRRRPDGGADLRVPVRARPGPDPAAGGDGHPGADAAGHELPARAIRAGAAALAQAPRCGDRDPRRWRPRRAGLFGDDPAAQHHGRRTAGPGAARGVWAERGQRDPGRLPRLRYLRRDHRVRHRSAGGACAAAAHADGTGADHARPADQAAGAGRPGPDHVPADPDRVDLPVPARPQRAGRAPRRWNRALASTTSAASAWAC
ncbi:hypothetical protein G6F22_010931 [Rhizopus arrhizus]|nr:hypothetical protein G6F22_010931 [Rhizopus arrhizus]